MLPKLACKQACAAEARPLNKYGNGALSTGKAPPQAELLPWHRLTIVSSCVVFEGQSTRSFSPWEALSSPKEFCSPLGIQDSG